MYFFQRPQEQFFVDRIRIFLFKLVGRLTVLISGGISFQILGSKAEILSVMYKTLSTFLLIRQLLLRIL